MRRMTAGRCGTVGLLVLVLALLIASSRGALLPRRATHALAAAGAGRLMAYGGRSAAQLHSPGGAKLDAALADLARHASRVRPGHELADLHALSPAARFTRLADGGVPLIAVDAVTRGDPQQLEQALLALGLVRPAVYANDVGGWLPVSAIGAASERAEVALLRAALSHTRAAALATQGDFTQGSAALRASYPTLSGAGVTVGILSDSFNCYGVYDQAGSGVPASGPQGYAPYGFAADDAAFDESNGYLTASVNVLEEADCSDYGQPLELPYTDEGRAMLQIVHVVAPGAALAFYTSSNSEADFANGIGALAAAGATVIADDTGYFDEPFFQDGLLAQAVDAVEAQGVAYFSAAGNNSQLSYENSKPVFAAQATTLGTTSGEHLLNFDTSGKTTTTSLPVTIPPLFPGEFVALVVEWDQPYVTGAPGSLGASSQIDLCVSGASNADTIINLDGESVTCTGPNATGSDAVQVLILGNAASSSSNTASQTIDLQIGLLDVAAAPSLVKVVVEDDGAGSTIDSFATNSPTLQGHPGAVGAAAVAAAFFAETPACGTTPAQAESFSSWGGDPILFDTSGQPLPTPQVRQKPDFTGPDGVNTSFFGFPLAGSGFADNSTVAQCQNDATYLNYFGTSAATPHAAAAAALMQQANPAVTPAQIYQNLRSSAAPMGTVPNFQSGYGFMQVAAAMALLPAGAPVVKLSASTVYVGYPSTLTWLAVNATSCTSSWGGSQPTSGSLALNTATAGSYAYTLTCTGASGPESSSATLTVQNIPPLAVTTSSLPQAEVGAAYSASLGASGGISPYTWSLAGGTLPAGLSLAASGTLAGTPTTATAAASLTFQVADAEKVPQTRTVNLSLTVAAAASSGGGSSGSGSGGGALDETTLLALAALACAHGARAARRTARAARNDTRRAQPCSAASAVSNA